MKRPILGRYSARHCPGTCSKQPVTAEKRSARIWDTVVAEHRDNIAAFARGLQGQRVCVEPSFLSALYGMQGRLDVLTEYPDDPALKNIYELKSGRPPGGTALWPSHQVQGGLLRHVAHQRVRPPKEGNVGPVLFLGIAVSGAQFPLFFYRPAVDRRLAQ